MVKAHKEKSTNKKSKKDKKSKKQVRDDSENE